MGDNFKMTDRGWQKGAASIEAVMDNVSGALEALIPGFSTGAWKKHHVMVAEEAEEMVQAIKKDWVCRVTRARERGRAVRSYGTVPERVYISRFGFGLSKGVGANDDCGSVSRHFPVLPILRGTPAFQGRTGNVLGHLSERSLLRVVRSIAR